MRLLALAGHMSIFKTGILTYELAPIKDTLLIAQSFDRRNFTLLGLCLVPRAIELAIAKTAKSST